MYAIVETGGKQYRVKPGDTIAIERIAGEPGEVLDLGRVLLVSGNGGGAARVGSPGVDGAIVRAEVVEHARGEKIIVFRYKSKVRYRRKTGHRQALTRLRITDILVDGQSSVTKAEAPVAVATPPPTRAQITDSPLPAEDEAAALPEPARRRAAQSPAEPTTAPEPSEPHAEAEAPGVAAEAAPRSEEASPPTTT
jgi:large subunit ribosomal protein L21